MQYSKVRITLILALCLATASYVVAQTTEPISVTGNNCEANKATFAFVATTAEAEETGKLVMLIARLGNGETSRRFNNRRLHNARTYLSHTHGISEKRIVIAEGERVPGHGRVEVYIDGKLIVVFNLERNQDLVLGGVGDCDGRSRLYYPTRGRLH
jgi:hypothetical protein